jgi:hypothetical protein
VQRSRQRGGSFSKDGYAYLDMFKEPKHKREGRKDDATISFNEVKDMLEAKKKDETRSN